MIYSEKIKRSIRFAIKTHEVYQKQKRKGKDIPYITHPLTVGLILAHAGAGEDVIVAGILHDTIEDCTKTKPVTKKMIADRFGETVAMIVADVTEPPKDVQHDQRKRAALEHIQQFSESSLLVKSADTLSNLSDLLSDYHDEEEKTFSRFNGRRDKILNNYNRVITALLVKWPESPLSDDLRKVQQELAQL